MCTTDDGRGWGGKLPAKVRDRRPNEVEGASLSHYSLTEWEKENDVQNACVVAPGDFFATKKIAESIVIGGMGGCIPIIVVNSHPSSMLPPFTNVASEAHHSPM